MSNASSVPPLRESAAVVLLRGEGEALEVFWVKRSDAVGYMPGFEAFIGGKVGPEDIEIAIEGAPEGPERILRACVIREAFEESGVLPALASPADLTALPEARRRLLAGEATFDMLAREHGWSFRADALTFAGRWMTPPFATQRFDTWFFIARVPEGQEPSVHVGELAAGEWIKPRDAIARWKSGEATFAAPILHTLIALDQGGDVAARLATAPERSGDPVRRIELKWGMVLHPMRTRPLPPATHTNAYLIGEREMALIDPGSGESEEIEALFKVIEMLEAEGRTLKFVLLTHHHPDHVEGVDAVRARRRVPVLAHAETAKHMSVDQTLDDGEAIPLEGGGGWTLHALHTPGHARGHLCFFHPRTRSLFTGDLITGGTGTVIVDPPEGDMAAYIESLERLTGEGIETLFPGHGSPQGGAMRRIQGLIAHRREREAKVVAALSNEPASNATLVERAYADTPRELWPYAERSLLAHLIKLEREGRAIQEGDHWRAS
ncbi:MAG: MBL fold metallo-hydrolase [Candidatus Eisenbacteria bacterium]|nr:MBL fold metallo-hydrolase [Candidatus Eisenbacteria bacterium]